MRFSSGLVLVYWPMAVAFVASVTPVAAMFFRVPAEELPRVSPPLSWKDAARVRPPAPAGTGCAFGLRWF